MQIALAAIVLLAAAWFTVLKPKDSDDDAGTEPVPAQVAPKAPGQQGLENAVSQAKGAVAASGSAAAATKAAATAASGDTATAKAATPPTAAAGRAATPSTSPPEVTATPARPATGAEKAATPTTGARKAATAASSPAVANGTAAATATPTPSATAKANGSTAGTAKAADPKAGDADADPSAPLLARLARGRTVVMLFTASKHNSIESAARRALAQLRQDDEELVIRIVPIRDVGRYAAITTGVAVLTSPTILVIGKDLKALSTSGYTELRTLKQMVGDVHRAVAAAAKAATK